MNRKRKKYVAIRAKTRFLNERDLTAYHATLFHGYARRIGDPADLDETGQSPLEYVYNLAADAWVTQPRTNLLFRREILDEALALSTFRKLPVQIVKQVMVPFAKGDMSFFSRPPHELQEIGGDYRRLLTEAAPIAPVAASVDFVELCLPPIPATALGEPFTLEYQGGGLLEIDVVRPGLEQPDFFYCEGGNVFEASRLGRLLEWIDTDYFEVKHLEI